MGGTVYLIHNPFSSDKLSLVVPQVFNAQSIREFVFNHDGPLYAMGASENMAYINTKYQDPSLDWPDVQIFFTSFSDVADGGIFSRRGSGVTVDHYSYVYEPDIYQDSIMAVPLVMRPQSRGRIRLNSADPMEYPLIYANYFEHPIDLDILVSFFTLEKFTHFCNFIECFRWNFYIFRLKEQNSVTKFLKRAYFEH